ncbi:MAG: hypothetical protein WCE61_15030 [Candidatus Acidiferrum sp.]
MSCNLALIENAELFIGQLASPDAISLQHCGVRSQARQNCGSGVLFGPTKEIDQGRPVWLFLQLRLARFRSSYDDSVKSAPKEVVEIPVEIRKVLFPAVSSGDAWQREECQGYREAPGGRVQEFEKLGLGILEGGVGHVVDQCDPDTVFASDISGNSTLETQPGPFGPVSRSSAFIHHL